MGHFTAPAVQAGLDTWTTKRNNTHPNWWQDAGMRKLGFWLGVCYLSMISVGFDGALLNGLQEMPYWVKFFNSPTGGYLGIMSAAQSIGAIPSGPFGSWVADRYGRKIPVMIGASLTIIGAIVQATATTPNIFIGSRVIIGFGNVVSYTIAPVLAAELCHPRQRGPAVALYNQIISIGSIIAAWTTFGTLYINSDWSWRLPVIIQAVGAVVQIICIPFAPESPRYLFFKGRVEEAHATLAKYHANGDMDDELVLFQLAEIQAAFDEVNARANTASWRETVSTPGNRKRTAICVIIGFGSQWNGYGIISYYLTPILNSVGITNSTKIAGLNGGLSVWGFLVGLVACLYVDRLGRRKIWLMAYSWMLMCYICITALSATFLKTSNASVGAGVVAFLFLHTAGSSFSTGLNIAYPCEIMPYHLRSKGVAIILCAAYIALCVNQYVNPLALAAINWKYYLVYVAILVCLVITMYTYFPETKGCTIEEVALIFDGDEHNSKLLNVTHGEETSVEEVAFGEKAGVEKEAMPELTKSA